MTYRRFSKRARAEIGSRGRCERCGAACPTRADYQVDHIIPEALRLADARPLTCDDGQLLCLDCHDAKTKRDVAEIARAKRLAAKHRIVAQGESNIARRWTYE